MKNSKERWVSIPELEGRYEVSSFGRVRSLDAFVFARNGHTRLHRGKVLNAHIDRCGYWYVSVPLARDGCTSKKFHGWTNHLLVLLAFVGPIPEGKETRHLDGNKLNARLDNLCYGTPKENSSDQRRHGTLAIGSKQGRSKLTKHAVLAIRREYAKGGTSHTKLAKKYQVTGVTIHSIVTGKMWRHVGGPRRRVFLTREEKVSIWKEYWKGLSTQKELARKWEVSQAYISKVVDTFDPHSRPKNCKLSLAEEHAIQKAYKKGVVTYGDLAAKWKVGKGTIWRIVADGLTKQ